MVVNKSQFSPCEAIEIVTSAEVADRNAQQCKGGDQLRVGQVVPPSASAKDCNHCRGEGHMEQYAIT